MTEYSNTTPVNLQNNLQPIYAPRIERPNADHPDVYNLMYMDESTLLDVESGILDRIERYKASIRQHDRCDPQADEGCRVGNNADIKTDCSEDLMFLYERVANLERWVFQMKFMRNTPNHLGTNVSHKE